MHRGHRLRDQRVQVVADQLAAAVTEQLQCCRGEADEMMVTVMMERQRALCSTIIDTNARGSPTSPHKLLHDAHNN